MAAPDNNPSSPGTSGFARLWHYRPPVPIEVSPFFSWPIEPKRMVGWLAARWINIAENSILVVVAFVCWRWFQPSLQEARTFAPGWIAEIYLRNLILLLMVAG